MDIQPPIIGSVDSDSSKRKRRAIAQGQKACNPCRQRKVRCSFESPCQTCIDRQLPELCLYDEPLQRVHSDQLLATAAAEIPSTFWIPSKGDWDELFGKIDRLEHSLQAILSRLPTTQRPYDNSSSSSDHPESARDMYGMHPITGDTVFLGGNSTPAMAWALSRSTDAVGVQDLLDKHAMPMFTLENNSATYPFVDLWGLPLGSSDRIERLCGLLPGHADCLEFLRHYRDTAHVLFPAIVDIQRFEAEATRFLVRRTAESANPNKQPLTEQDVYGRDLHWLGLLFACFSGLR